MKPQLQLPQQLCYDWRLKNYVFLTKTANATVFRARRFDEKNVVIKWCFLQAQEIEQSITYLHWQNGIACIHLIDRQDNFLMLEDAGDKLLMEEIIGTDDRSALETAAVVVAEMHKNHARFSGKLPTLVDLYEPLQKALNFLPLKDDHDRTAVFYRQALDLLSQGFDEDNFRPLHGDIHFDNIMLSPRGWLAIDPHGYYGHRAFDYANLFYNPLERPDITDNLERIRFAVSLFSRVSHLSPRCLLYYAFLYGCLSAFWYRDENNGMEQSTLKTARLIFNEWQLLSG